MSGNEHRLGKWYNASCDKNLKVICQTLIKQNSTQSNDSSPVETDMTYDGVLFQKVVLVNYSILVRMLLQKHFTFYFYFLF